jgi:iron complex outermembrane receptor protein
LTLTVGARYSDDRKTFHGSIQDGLFVDPATIVAVPETYVKDTIVTPKATLSYQFTNFALGYFTVARGYRAGGFNGLAVGDPTILGKPYQPERDWSYELGTKLQLLDRRLTLNAAAYYEQLTDLQETAATSDGSFATQNAAKAHVEGLELESSYTPLAGLNFYGNLTLTADGYDQLAATTEAAEAGATQLPLLSPVKAQVGGSYSTSPSFMQGYKSTFAADYSYDAPHYSDAEDTTVGLTTASNRVNASLEISTPDGHWSVVASGRNILNEKYYFSGISFITGVISSRFPAQPATWMLSLKYHY